MKLVRDDEDSKRTIMGEQKKSNGIITKEK
jgi:hypothetical protein